MQPDVLAAAVRRCPFLARVGAAEGEAFARTLAANPFASASAGPVLLEEDAASSFAATLRLFHGPRGVVPLRRFNDDATAPGVAAPGSCPFLSAGAPLECQPPPAGHSSSRNVPAAASPQPNPAPAKCSAAASSIAPLQPAGLPFASISLSGFGAMPDPGRLFDRMMRAKQQRQRSKQQQQRKPAADAGTAGPSKSSTSSSSSGARPGAAGSNKASSNLGSSAPNWHKVVGGLIPLAANGTLTCPTAIVKMRAAVAALKPVRQLRPQALPIRALAMGGTAVAANLPCGAWREHTVKFSPQWFLAVHATIPFVAMLRKAVLMPRWAIALTIVGAIAGQAVGARVERRRVRQVLSPAAPAASRRSSSSTRAPRGGSALLASDCVMPSLETGCRQCLQAAQSAVAWTLAPVLAA